MDDSIISDHIRIRIPMERQWLGREAVSELERCWRFIDRSTDGKLPDRLLIIISWDEDRTSSDLRQRTISVGMGGLSSSLDMKAFVVGSSAREMARMALLELSHGGAAREPNRFLLEGMSEILAHEYSGTTRSLLGAWIHAQYLARRNQLGLKAQSSWTSFSGGLDDLRAAAPGITLINTCRDLFGRDRILKLFEELDKKSLEESLASAFKSSAAAVEARWLARVAEYDPADITVAGEDDAPRLERTVFVPENGNPGAVLQARVFVADRTGDLRERGVYLTDQDSGTTFEAQAAYDEGVKCMKFEVPIPPERRPGRYTVRITAVDEAGNIRIWHAEYGVAARN